MGTMGARICTQKKKGKGAMAVCVVCMRHTHVCAGASTHASPLDRSPASLATRQNPTLPPIGAQAKPGSGRITTSGPIVTGYDTRFLSELKVYDAIIVQHPTT